MVSEVFALVQRRLLWGQMRIRDRGFQETELAAGESFDHRLGPAPESVRLLNWTDSQTACASVDYDFHSGDQIIFSRVYDLDFDADTFQRLQLYLRPDDSWHELSLTVERSGRRYVAERTVPLANCAWQTVTWQEPSTDDQSTKIKTWILLRPVAAAPGECLDQPRQIKLTFELRRAGAARAWWNKLTLNYVRVLDSIPSAYDVAEGINDTAYMYTLEQVLKQPGVADSPKGKEAAEFLASLQQAIPFLPEVKGLASDSDLARVGQGAKDEARLYVQAWREKIAGFLKELKK